VRDTAPIYLDNHATTRPDPRVVAAMLPYLEESYGNAASRHHAFGWDAERAVDRARRTLASALGAAPNEIVFTSGTTESVNLALQGAARARRPRGRHLVTTAIEHPAVLETLEALTNEGFELEVVGVDGAGRVDPAEFAAALREDTTLASVMFANNEVGAIQPIAKIGAACRARGVWLHVDAAQALGRLPIDLAELPVELLSASAHKMHGPKGAGLLFCRSRAPHVTLEPVFFGGGHERGLRPGTLDVPAIVGFATALEIALADREGEQARIAALRDRLESLLLDSVSGARRNGPDRDRLAANLNLSIPGVAIEAVLAELEGLAVSSGSACASASQRPSHVLAAMGLSPALARASLRFGLSRFTTLREVDAAAEQVAAAVAAVRSRSPRTAGGNPKNSASID